MTDVAVITVKPAELRAVLDVFLGVEREGTGTPPPWQTTTVKAAYVGGGPLGVTITMVGEAGNERAAAHTTRCIERLRPQLVCLVGMACAVRRKARLYDVVTSKIVWDYEGARLEPTGPAPRPDVYRLLWRMDQDIAYSQAECENVWLGEWRHMLGRRYEGRQRLRPPDAIRHHHAAIASGQKLLGDGQFLNRLRRRADERIRCADMESAGFASACAAHCSPVSWLVVRGLSDFGDPATKPGDDRGEADRQYWATVAAALYLRAFLSSGLTECGLGRTPAASTRRQLSQGRGGPSLRYAILDALRDGPTAGEDLASRLGVTPAICRPMLEWLRAEGTVSLKNGLYSLAAADSPPDTDERANGTDSGD